MKAPTLDKPLNMCRHTIMCGEFMANMTLTIPENMRKDMKQFPEIKWSEVARKAIAEKLEVLQMANKIASKSKLTEKDVKEFSDRIKESATKRFLA